jgi:solute carrier family 13 (sodium-dependent dicarboxylate transporter), member 2/3/5
MEDEAKAGHEAASALDSTRSRVALWLGPLAFLIILALPSALAPGAHRLAAVMALVMIFWIGEPVPLPVTSLMGPVLAVLLGVSGARDAFAPFGDPVIFLFLGSFLLAEALRVHGLDRRIALAILAARGVAASPVRLRIAVAVVTAGISMWISNTATAAMMLPIALGLVRALAAAGSTESPRALLLIVGMAASLGGMATPVGTPPNMIALGVLERQGGRTLGFLPFMSIGVPLSLALLSITLAAVRWLVPRPAVGADVSAYVEAERRALAPWAAGQWACAVAFALAITFWIGPGIVSLFAGDAGGKGRGIEESVVAVGAAVLLFLWPVGDRKALTWEDGKRIDWGTLLLFGGGLSLGKMMFDSGLAASVGRAAVDATGVTTLWGLTALALATTIVLTEIASNTATVTMLAPLVLALAGEMGVPVVPPVLAVAFGASMGFMFPVGTPPNAIVYGTGLVPLTAMMRIGVMVDILGFFVILAALRVLCPLLGLT